MRYTTILSGDFIIQFRGSRILSSIIDANSMHYSSYWIKQIRPSVHKIFVSWNRKEQIFLCAIVWSEDCISLNEVIITIGNKVRFSLERNVALVVHSRISQRYYSSIISVHIPYVATPTRTLSPPSPSYFQHVQITCGLSLKQQHL
jgi:hypothetical protein